MGQRNAKTKHAVRSRDGPYNHPNRGLSGLCFGANDYTAHAVDTLFFWRQAGKEKTIEIKYLPPGATKWVTTAKSARVSLRFAKEKKKKLYTIAARVFTFPYAVYASI